MSSPSTAISLGGVAPESPVTLICNWTGRSTSVSELVKTAVTVGASARAAFVVARASRIANKSLTMRERAIFKPNIAIQTGNKTSPVVIDRTHAPVFIKLHFPLLVFHRFEQESGLFWTHLALLFGFGFRSSLGRGFLFVFWVLFACTFYLTG